MVVVTLTDCPPRLRGDLSKWLLEINTGVYVGKVSARVREELWERICENILHGRATMVYNTNNEQGIAFHVHNTTWKPIDFEGITLMLRPAAASKDEKEEYKSKAAVMNMLHGKTIAKQKKHQKEGYVVFDLETTGLHSDKDEIIELAAIRIIGNRIVDELECLVIPEKSIPQAITKLTGINQTMVDESGIQLDIAIAKFIDFVGTSVIVGHNISFDRAFLDAACKKLGRSRINNSGKDTMQLARRNIDDEISNYRLETVAEYFKIPVDEKHRAMVDCKTTFYVYKKLNEI